MSLAKIALIAGIAVGLARANWVVGQILAMRGLTDFHWIYVLQLVGNTLFLIPLPLTLILIYRTGTKLVVSKTLGHLALFTGVIYGVLFTTPALLGWVSTLHRAWTNLQWFEGVTVADKVSNWLGTGGIANAVNWAANSITIFSQVAFTLFMIAIFPQAAAAPELDVRQSKLLRIAALWATILAGLTLIWNIGGQAYAAIHFNEGWQDDLMSGVETRTRSVLRNAFSELPFVCWMIAVFIVYRSQLLKRAVTTSRAADS